MITDQNVLNFSAFDNFDNEVMFENLLIADTGAPPVEPTNSVPVPGTLALFGIALLGFGFSNRKKYQS